LPVVSGVIFRDDNSNGIKDTNEVYQANKKVMLSNGNFTFTNQNGYYQILADSIGAYTVTIDNKSFYNAVPAIISYNFTSYDTMVTASIALQPTIFKDTLALNITAINARARQGRSFPYLISYENVGTTTINPTINFSYNNTKLVYDSSSNSNTVHSGNNVSLNVGNISPGTCGSFIAYFTVKTTVSIGDSINVNGAATYAESVKTVSIVTGSFDPNDKQATPVLTPNQVAVGDYINYTIRFQNTGNDTAFRVVISDVLSNNLQTNSLVMLASSHNCKTSIINNIIYFEFVNIELADSFVNEKASYGFVSFKIKPKSTVIAGNNIPNTAAIYFDYNAPIITNTIITQIKNPLLPLRIMSYELRLMNEKRNGINEKQVINNWVTTNEMNVSHFVIQRSEDGSVFKSVGTIEAAGNGRYQFTDPFTISYSPFTLYYRLQIIDKDGSFSFSEVKRVTLNEQQETRNVFLYPNPARDNVTISTKENVQEIKIINQLGKLIKQYKNVINLQNFNTQQFSKGIYIVQIVTAKGVVRYEKLIVE